MVPRPIHSSHFPNSLPKHLNLILLLSVFTLIQGARGPQANTLGLHDLELLLGLPCLEFFHTEQSPMPLLFRCQHDIGLAFPFQEPTQPTVPEPFPSSHRVLEIWLLMSRHLVRCSFLMLLLLTYLLSRLFCATLWYVHNHWFWVVISINSQFTFSMQIQLSDHTYLTMPISSKYTETMFAT